MKILVYPEYYDGPLLGVGIEIFGRSHHGFSRMFIQQDGKTIFYYDKTLSDGKNLKSTDVYQPKIHEVGNVVALGLICCMDVQAPDVVQGLMEKLNLSDCLYKVICISANMTDKSWFNSVNPPLDKVYVVLSNGCEFGPSSFISDNNGTKLNDTEICFNDICIEVAGVGCTPQSSE